MHNASIVVEAAMSIHEDLTLADDLGYLELAGPEHRLGKLALLCFAKAKREIERYTQQDQRRGKRLIMQGFCVEASAIMWDCLRRKKGVNEAGAWFKAPVTVGVVRWELGDEDDPDGHWGVVLEDEECVVVVDPTCGSWPPRERPQGSRPGALFFADEDSPHWDEWPFEWVSSFEVEEMGTGWIERKR